MLKIDWIPYEHFENNCKELGVTWEIVENVKLTQIDIKKSLRNNARLHKPLDEDNLLSCGIDMENGKPIHIIALRKIPSEELMVIIGGNHRVNQLKEHNITTATAYVVKCTNKEFDLLARRDNRINRLGQGKEEAIEHAIFMHEQHGMTIVELCKLFSLSTTIMQRIARNGVLRKELENQHIPCEHITAAALDALNPLKDQKAILYRVAHICNTYIPSAAKVSEAADVVRGKNTEQQKMDYLQRWEHTLKQSAPPPGKKLHKRAPTKTKLFRLMGVETGLLSVLINGGQPVKGDKTITNINQLGFDPADADRLIQLYKQIQNYLRPLITQSEDLVKQVDPANKKKRR